MIKKLSLIFVFMIFVVSINAAPSKGNKGKNNMMKESVDFEDLSPDQKERMMELRAELLHKEASINNRMRDLRSEMNKCMLSKNPDMKKFDQMQKESVKLREERRVLKSDYMYRMHKIINQQSK
ncbi:Spy/CpxP family protein refolding chaperone [Ilyobacter sp.]|uniref:Spy/CpxP family protein refolding chaperone n=1 Tax=Ilyobacter sp. TaxID=3100343 RepID=UPI003569D2C6